VNWIVIGKTAINLSLLDSIEAGGSPETGFTVHLSNGRRFEGEAAKKFVRAFDFATAQHVEAVDGRKVIGGLQAALGF